MEYLIYSFKYKAWLRPGACVGVCNPEWYTTLDKAWTTSDLSDLASSVTENHEIVVPENMVNLVTNQDVGVGSDCPEDKRYLLMTDSLEQVACATVLTFDEVVDHYSGTSQEVSRIFSWPEGKEFKFVKTLKAV